MEWLKAVSYTHLDVYKRQGLVTRELCNEDRRQMYYSLTQQGRELLASVSCREVETPEILRNWLCG